MKYIVSKHDGDTIPVRNVETFRTTSTSIILMDTDGNPHSFERDEVESIDLANDKEWVTKWKNPYFAAEELMKFCAELQEKGVEPDTIEWTHDEEMWVVYVSWTE